MDEPIRVLQCVTIMNRNGLENRLMDIYRNIDRSVIQFDFMTNRTEDGEFDEEIKSLGGRVYHMSRIAPRTFFRYIGELRIFFQEHPEYKIVHSHLNTLSTWPLLMAKRAGVPVRIAHSRNASMDRNIKMIYKAFSRLFINRQATDRFACSRSAGVWLFGKQQVEKKNFHVLEAGDGEEAMDIFYEEKDIALLILDVMMPKMDGWEVCREIRKNSKVPIIMLTARGDERDELLGFDLGVDEYISKPFSPKILVARVEAILRRTGQDAGNDVLSAGGIVIDKSAHQASVDGKPMELSFKEFELLTYFLENQGIALSREKILNSVWNYDYFGDARTIDTHVKKLRSKMGEKGEYIKTVWGMGYKFEVDEA